MHFLTLEWGHTEPEKEPVSYGYMGLNHPKKQHQGTAYALMLCLTIEWGVERPENAPPHISIGTKASAKQL